LRTPRDPQGIDRARKLRREMTPPEHALWRILRGHRLQGWKFTRQVPAGPFTLDFAARRERLAIELDGDSHGQRELQDAHRRTYLEKSGWTVIRFTNLDIVRNAEGVTVAILEALAKIGPSPHPSPQRGEGE
jgi:very-short-patch-repair endonuclease